MGARERGRPARCSRNVVARLSLLRVACQQRTGIHTRKRKRQRPSCSLGGAPTKPCRNRPRASGSVVWGCLPASMHAFMNVLGRLGQGRRERPQTLQPSDNGGGMDLGDPVQQRAYSLHPPHGVLQQQQGREHRRAISRRGMALTVSKTASGSPWPRTRSTSSDSTLVVPSQMALT